MSKLKGGKIYTHTAKSHVDEFIACAILCMKFDIQEIVMVSDMDGVEVGPMDFVVDIGRRYDKVQWFDHHQDDPAVNGRCAASLVAEAYAPELYENREWKKFFRRADIQDNFGFQELQNKLLIPRDKAAFMLTVEWGLTGMFEEDPLGVAKFYSRALSIASEDVKKVKAAGEWLNNKDNAHAYHVDGHMTLVLERDPKEDGLEGKHIKSAQTESINDLDIEFVYSFDERTDDRMLFRTYVGQDAGADLTKGKPENLVFAHKGGFLTVFKPADDKEFERLIVESFGE